MSDLQSKKNKSSTGLAKNNTLRQYVQTFFVWCNGLLLLPVIIAGAAPYISPTFNWIPTLLSLAISWLALIPALWACFWVAWNRVFMSINLLVLIGLYPQLQHLYRTSSPFNPSPSDVTLISYNVAAFDYKYDRGFDIIATLIPYRPDILVLQEFWNAKDPQGDSSIIELIQKHMGFKYVSFVALIPTRYGMAIFSKFPIVNSGRVTDLNQKARNGAAYADLKMYGETLRIYNLHLESYQLSPAQRRAIYDDELGQEKLTFRTGWSISKTLAKTWYRQQEQVQQICKHIQDSIVAPKSVIICGDLNNPPYNYIYRAVRGSLQDAFLERGSGWGTTYGKGLGAFRIDYIFVSQTLLITQFETLISCYQTDHKPVMARFRYRNIL